MNRSNASWQEGNITITKAYGILFISDRDLLMGEDAFDGGGLCAAAEAVDGDAPAEPADTDAQAPPTGAPTEKEPANTNAGYAEGETPDGDSRQPSKLRDDVLMSNLGVIVI